MDGIRRGVHTLHLIKHHTLVSEGLGLILNIVMPALLLERPWRQSWVQHRVEINIDQIVEVFQVLRTYFKVRKDTYVFVWGRAATKRFNAQLRAPTGTDQS